VSAWEWAPCGDSEHVKHAEFGGLNKGAPVKGRGRRPMIVRDKWGKVVENEEGHSSIVYLADGVEH